MSKLMLYLFAALTAGFLSLPASASSDTTQNWTSAAFTTESGWKIEVTTTNHSKTISSFRAFHDHHEITVPSDIFKPVDYPILGKIKVMQSNLDGDFYILVPGIIIDANGNGTKAHLLTIYFKNSIFLRSSLETVDADLLDGL